jgi:signal transduction histidine kinase
MNPSAQVHSLELLKRLHAVLARFGVDAEAALGQAAMDVLHVHNTLADRLKYWQQQVYKRQEDVNRARSDLTFARAIHDGKTIGCVEQELALRKAQERLREAEGKVVTVRRWQQALPEQIKDYEGPARTLTGFLEADLRQALVLLQDKIATLEAYLAIPSPGAKPTPPPPRPQGSPCAGSR